MCLDRKWEKEHRDDWLKEQPKTITAYKAVIVKKKPRFFGLLGKKTILIPPYFLSNSYKKRNRLRKKIKKVRCGDVWAANSPCPTYLPYYHLYLKLEEAEETQAHMQLIGCSSVTIVRCKVPKKLITEIGFETKKIVIITKGFTIIEEVKD